MLYRNFGVPASATKAIVYNGCFMVFFTNDKGNRVLFVAKDSYSEGEVTVSGNIVTPTSSIFRWGDVSSRIVNGETVLPQENNGFPATSLAKLYRSLIY